MARPAGGRQPRNPRPRGLGAELVPVALILAALAGTLALIVAMYRRPPSSSKAEPPGPVVAVPPKPAPVVVPPKPRPKARPVPPPAEDPTPGALAALADREADERRQAEAADRKAEALERARQAAISSAERRRRRVFAVRQRAKALEDQARSLEGEANTLAAERDALVRERDLAKDELMRAQVRSQTSLAVLPYKGANGTWRRPIAIECANGTATLQPTGPTFGMSDLAGLGLGRANALAVAVARAYIRVQGSHTPDGAASVPYIVFVVRPDGIRAYYEALARLEPLGLAFGYELVEQDAVIEFPDPEAPGAWDDAPAPRAFGPLSRRGGSGGGAPARGVAPGRGGPEDPGPDPRALAAIAGRGPSADGRIPLDIGGDDDEGPLSSGPDDAEPGFGPPVHAPNPRASVANGDPDAPRPLRLESLRAGPPRFQPDTRATRNDPVLQPVPASPRGGGPGAGGPGGLSTPKPPSPSLPRPGNGTRVGAGSTQPVGTGGNLGPRSELASSGGSGAGYEKENSQGGGPLQGTGTSEGGGTTGSNSPGRTTRTGAGSNTAAGRRTASWRAVGSGGNPASSNDPNGLAGGFTERGGSGSHDGSQGRPSDGVGLASASAAGEADASGNGNAKGPVNPWLDPSRAGGGGMAGADAADGGDAASGSANGIKMPAGAGNASPGASNKATTASGADASGSASSPFGTPGQPQQESRVAEPKKFPLDHRPPRPLELVVVCDESGLTLYPGAYRLRAKTLEAGEGELPRRLRALVEARETADPSVHWEPRLRFRIEPGGQQSYWKARRQTLVAGVDWPVTIQVADPDRVRGLGTERR